MRPRVADTVNAMPAIAKRTKPKQTADVMANATDRLLRAVKKKMLRDDGQVDYDKLHREGFSVRVIARLKEL